MFYCQFSLHQIESRQIQYSDQCKTFSKHYVQIIFMGPIINYVTQFCKMYEPLTTVLKTYLDIGWFLDKGCYVLKKLQAVSRVLNRPQNLTCLVGIAFSMQKKKAIKIWFFCWPLFVLLLAWQKVVQPLSLFYLSSFYIIELLGQKCLRSFWI